MDVFDLFAKISIDTSEYDSGLKNASGKLKSFASGMEKSLSGAKKFFEPAVKGFQAVEGVGKKAGDLMSTGLKGFMAASTAVAGFGGAAVNAGMSFDAAMSQVSSVSGATGEDFDALRNKAIEMGAKTQFSASEAAEAMNYMAMAGWKTEDMLGGISGIMNLAAASGEDLASTSDIVTDALTAFGMTAGDSGHFADVLAAASSNANTNVSMMGETFKYVAPIAGAMGYSAEDTALAIGLMANSSIKGSQAGTSLRSVLTRMAKPTKESSAAMDALGISITNSDGSMKSLGTVIGDLRIAFSGLSAEEKTTYAAMLGGQEAMSGLLAIVTAAPADVEKLTEALNDCNGAAEKMANTRLDNLAGDVKLFKSALESLQISVSDALNPTLREFTQFGTKAMEQLTMGFQQGGTNGFFSALTGVVTQAVQFLAEKAPEFVKISMQFVESLATGILNSKEQIITAFNQSVNVLIDGLDAWLNENGESLLNFGMRMVNSIFNGFTSAGDLISEHIGTFIPLIANAFLSYHEALFTVGMDILGAIGRGISENKDTITELASSTIASMVTAFVENAPSIIDGAIALLEVLVQAFLDNLPMITQAAVEIVSYLASSIGQALPELIPAAVEAVITFVEGLTSPSNLSMLIDGALQLITGLADGILQALPKIVAAAPVIITNLVTGLIASLPKIFEAAVEIIISLAKGLIQAIPELLKAVPQIMLSLLEAIIAFVVNFVQAGVELITALGKGISDSWESIVSFFSTALEDLIQFLARAWKTISEGVKEAWDGIVKLFQAAWEAIEKVWSVVVDFFSGIWEGIKGVFASVVEVLGGAFKEAWEVIQGVWEAAVSFFSGIWEAIQGVFSSVAEVLGGFFSAAWDAVVGVWEAATSFFSGIWEAIVGVFQGAAEWFGSLFSSVWNAITTAWSNVGSFFSGIWDTITGAFAGAFDTFANIGGNIVQGLWSGIQNLAGWLWDKISGWVQSIWDGVTSFFDIHSPSGKFEWMSEMNIKGAVQGVDKYGYKAVDAMRRMGEDMTEALRQDVNSFTPQPIQFSAYTNSSTPYNSSYSAPYGAPAAQGGPVVNIYSPKAVDAVEAARVWKKEMQKMALAYV